MGRPVLTPEWLHALEQHAQPAALRSRCHGPRHWRDVARVAQMLCDAGGDRDVALAFAAIHDSQRHDDQGDPGHAERAATLVRALAASDSWPLSSEQTDRLTAAVRLHNEGNVTNDPVIGPCWDADRLTLWRVGITPSRELLSTSSARGLFDQPEITAILNGGDVSWRQILETRPAAAAPRALRIRLLSLVGTKMSPGSLVAGGVAIPEVVPIGPCLPPGRLTVHHGTAGSLGVMIVQRGGLWSDPVPFVTTEPGIAATYAYLKAESSRASGGEFFGALVTTQIDTARLRLDQADSVRQYRLASGGIRVTRLPIVRFEDAFGNEPAPVVSRGNSIRLNQKVFRHVSTGLWAVPHMLATRTPSGEAKIHRIDAETARRLVNDGLMPWPKADQAQERAQPDNGARV
jgi:uncharacterized protein